jgi:hypothetical protein
VGRFIDTSFDFRTDTPPGRDPDKYSRTLQRYHQLLWSKHLPTGKLLELSVPQVGGYLYHLSDLGEFHLSSDGMIPSYATTKRMQMITSQVPDNIVHELQKTAYTIGGFILFPGKRINNKMTINGARGFSFKIQDRFDLTLECIKRHYANMESPLSGTLSRYGDFFKIFDDFRTYADYFLLQDMLTDGGDVKFLLPFDGFERSAFPLDVGEYIEYAEQALSFIRARSSRMLAAIDISPHEL